MSLFDGITDKDGNPKYPKSWEKLFKDNIHILEKVQGQIDKFGGDFYPKPKEIFKAYKTIRVDQIKVILIGQDPYHNTNSSGQPVAMGLSFSVRSGSPIAKSLMNIFKVVKKNIGKDSICAEDGDLTPWAKQGVFLINACLTVTPGEAGSHKQIWTGFINRTLEYIFKNTSEIPIQIADEDSDDEESDDDEEEEPEPVAKNDLEKEKYPIALLLGANAQRYENLCRGVIIKSSHPSPFSAHRGFMDSRCFAEINMILKRRKQKTIDW